MSRMVVKPHRVDTSRIDDSSPNEYFPNALKFLNKNERSMTQLQLVFDTEYAQGIQNGQKCVKIL